MIRIKKYISLTDFLEFEDRNTTIFKSGKQWSLWHQIAIENLEAGMPEVGEEVYTLVAGHGGGGGDRRLVQEIDEVYIYLARGVPGEQGRSMVLKDRWFRYIVRKEHETKIDLKPFRNSFRQLIYFIVGL